MKDQETVLSSYTKALDELTVDLDKISAKKEDDEKENEEKEFCNKVGIRLSKVESHLKEDFINLGFNQFMFVPVSKTAELLAKKYDWDSGSVWAVKEVEGEQLLVRDESEEIVMAKRAMRTVEKKSAGFHNINPGDNVKIIETGQTGKCTGYDNNSEGNVDPNWCVVELDEDGAVETFGESELEKIGKKLAVEQEEIQQGDRVQDAKGRAGEVMHDYYDEASLGEGNVSVQFDDNSIGHQEVFRVNELKKIGQLSGDIWEVPNKVIDDVKNELETREHPLSESEEQDLGKIKEEKKERTAASSFTPEEEEAIISAAARTWPSIASDVAELGPVTVAIAIEMVCDADRIVSFGGLDSAIYSKFPDDYNGVEKLLKKNKDRWY